MHRGICYAHPNRKRYNYLDAVITQNTIQQILNRIEILEIIGGFVRLKRRGANYLGLCPFHNEKTPSFTVSPSKEIYKCFGCGKSGNTISFLMEHEKLSYVEALKWLANKYNVEVEETEVSPEQKVQQQTSESLFIVNQFAQQFFSKSLFETDEGKDIALTYLQERGFAEDTIKKFGLGYAPDSKDIFAKQAIAQQYNPELLQKAGLVVNRNEQLVDNYRNRIIFPVHNNSGKVIGFGARLIKSNDKAPKYINTPENELYIKSKILYGTYFARHAIDKANECLLVEGYTDVISLHQAGIENVVASGGTSLTQDQLRLIKKYTKNLTIIYDGDAAGVKAALRGLDMALGESLNVKLVLIPEKQDPDSYVKKIGANEFQNFILHNKKDFILFQLEVSLKDAGADSNKKSEVVNQIAETISKIDKSEDFTKQQDYIRQCSEILNIDESGFTALVNKFIRDKIAKEEKLPFDEARYYEENARKGQESEFDDHTWELLFKDELQEREIARVLVENGNKPFDEKETIAEHILNIMPEEELVQNKTISKLLHIYQELISYGNYPDQNFFVYHSDHEISTLVVSLLHSRYELSERWKKDLKSGYQAKLTQQSAEGYFRTINDKDELAKYLNISRDNSKNEAYSAAIYLRYKKILNLIRMHSIHFEKHNPTQEQLKDPEFLREMALNIQLQYRLKEEQKKIINGYQIVITAKPQ